ncbi:autotransporter domain-containing protein [Bradyrhizobium sp. 170]|uniref:autotransporter outer membrane beta-barrel domain-containing protein n=1 Tax=Bradyrhizobium sp. 170 TaxID=2782641 RepID=UPI0020005A79|nr:autotransporter domain-containing protein [Bradyrhizobium sp. 170]UPK06693.1 autotransporter domain-containing protein [Bradyrhizobium sp. 170]
MSAFVVGLCLSTTPANAACAPDPASSGQTVTCSGNTPGGFQAGGGVSNLTINVLPGATVGDGGGGAAISVLDFGSTIANSGTLTAVAFNNGVFALSDDHTINNLASGIITVGNNSVGISLNGERGTISNIGTITVGDFGAGIDVFGNDAKITSSGVINVGDITAGISTQGDRALITHSGTINGGIGSAGVAFNGSSGTVNNSGRILLGDDAFGIVVVGDSNTITNSGTITVGAGFAVGIDVSSFGGSNSIINTGTINIGANATGILLSGTGSVFNSGTINAATGFAAIQFCGCGVANVLTLGPGSVINGFVLGTGIDTFQLGGTGKDTFNLSNIGLASQFDGFSTFNKVDSSNWMVIGFGNNLNWNVLGGTLTVNGVISQVMVNAGGTLAGTGIVSDTWINSGGVLQPGNGAAGSSLTISGSLAFQSGALYLVQLNSTSSSYVSVAGVAALNGRVGASVAPGTNVQKQYTILTAGTGVTGSFTGVDTTGLASSLVPTLSYDTNNVYLNFALNYGGGLNVNQQNVANTLTNFFSTTGGLPVGFASLSPAGLTQVSGELATGSQQATFDAMNLFLSLMSDPFVAGRNGGFGGNAGAIPFAEESALGYAAKKPRVTRDAFAKFPTKADIARNDLFDQRWSVWGAAFGGGSNTSGNAALGSNDATARAFGFAVGADYRLSRDTLAGFALAGGGTNFSVSGFGSGRSDLFQAGAFVRHNIGAAYITAAAAYGWQDVTTERTVTVAGFERLRAQFNANAYSGRIEGGYRYLTPWMGITPYAAGQFTTYSLPAYAEQVLAGAGTFALNYAAKDVTASRTELGVRTDKSFAVSSGILTLRGRAAWAHDFNTDRNVTALFQTLPGAAFVVNGAAQAHDSSLVTGAAEMKWLNGWSAAAIFEGQFSSVTNSYAGKGIVRYAW